MRIGRCFVVVAVLGTSCGDGKDGDAGDGDVTGDDGSGGGDGSGAGDGDGSDDGGTGDGGSGDDGGGSGDDGGTGTGDGGSGDGGTGDGGGEVAGCPDPLPSGWIFCEDFEDLADPATRFFEYDDAGGDFVVVDDEGASGTHSMRTTYRQGQEGAGWISVAFGRNPIIYGGRPHYDQDADHDEIYWRLRLRMEPGWPDEGPHKVTRATAFAKDNWGQAMIAHLWSAGSDVTLLGDPAMCVTGSNVDCDTYNDFANLQWLGQMNGTTPLFSSGLAGQWHCIEGHVKLNDPGADNGVFEFWIDGNLENARQDLDWRGSWAEYGINLTSFENYWNGGPSQDLDRWMDDIVVATEPIGCG